MKKDKEYIRFRFDNKKIPASLFNGRIGRSQFIFSFTCFSIISFILGQLVDALANFGQLQINHFEHIYGPSSSAWIPFMVIEICVLLLVIIVATGFILIFISVFSRRFHDIGKSGYWGIIGIIPYLNLILVLFLLFKKGTNGINKFGEAPSTFFI